MKLFNTNVMDTKILQGSVWIWIT